MGGGEAVEEILLEEQEGMREKGKDSEPVQNKSQRRGTHFHRLVRSPRVSFRSLSPVLAKQRGQRQQQPREDLGPNQTWRQGRFLKPHWLQICIRMFRPILSQANSGKHFLGRATDSKSTASD